MKKKIIKKNNISENQNSFFFEDYLQTNLRQKKLEKSSISEDRLYLLFIAFFSLIVIFSISIISISLQKSSYHKNKIISENFPTLRRDIIDRNGELISRNINSYHAAIKPNLINNKENFILKIKLIMPEISTLKLKNNFKKNKYFYLKKRLTEEEKSFLWALGEKGIIFEPFQTRIYPHKELYSHILGQVDEDNYGISGIEKYYDKELKNIQEIKKPLNLSLDTNIQYLIKNELKKAMIDFETNSAGALLMDVNSGEVLSLVSLPDYNINIRENIKDIKYMNQITKGVFELGSVFKTFTLAIALDKNILTPNTVIKNIPDEIKCSKYTIGDIHDFPDTLTAQDILIRSSNIGSLIIGRKVGEEKFKQFFDKLGILKPLEFEIEETGRPLSFKWEKCKLETISYGHGITTTPLQAAAAYAAISNGGYIIKPTLQRKKNSSKKESIITEETSKKINKILRKVVTDEEGTASLANVFGYDVGGKTGTSKKYEDKNKNVNTFISIFPSIKPNYVLLVILDDPKGAPHITYNYKGNAIKDISRTEAGWNSVYTAGKIIEQIGPILAINNNEVYSNHVVKKNN